MTLTHEESNTLSTLQTIVATIQEVAELRSTNANLSTQYAEDQTTIAVLLNTRSNLEATLAEVRQALSDALARESQLRSDLANSEHLRITAERELIDANAANVSLSGDKDFWYREALTNETLRRDAEAKFTEADTKLARFRDILGVPAPVNPAPVLESPTLDLLASPVTQEPIDLPNPIAPQEAETTVNPTAPDFDSQPGFYRYP